MFPQNHRFRSIAAAILVLLCASFLMLAPATPAQAISGAFFHTQNLGNRGTDVKAIQYLLNLYPSGVFDSATDSAVRSFQQSRGLSVDGIVGPATWGKLIVTVRYGSSGNAVRAVQTLLNEKMNAGLSVNGTFDAATDTAVHNFQSHAQLTSDGIVGPDTWTNLIWHYERINFNQANVCAISTVNGDAKWGTAAAVGQMEAVVQTLPATYGPVAIEELSLEHGGNIDLHASHEVGLDVDIRPITTDRQQCRFTTNPSDPYYDQAATRELVKAIRAQAPGHVKVIWFNDQTLINEGLTAYYTGHDDHLHVRYCEKVYSDSRYDC